MDRVVTSFGRFSSRLHSLAMWGAVVALVVMVLAAGYQVVARYIFDAPPVWTEELARRAMVWAGMLGATGAFYERADPNLFPGLLTVEGGLGKLLALLRGVGVLLFAAPILIYSVMGPNFAFGRGFIARTLERKAEMMGISMAWFTLAVPVAFAIIVIHMLAQTAQGLAGIVPVLPEHPEDSAL